MDFVSVHGGHSGQFCRHAKDTLEEVVLAYIDHGYRWVGITEHMPGISRELLYPDQQEAGDTPESLLTEFESYIDECRRLQKKYADTIHLYTALEIETYSGYETFVTGLMNRFRPDYLVGSLHFVDDLGFDFSAEQYRQTAERLGGIDRMYCRYFDQQLEMLEQLRPAVVGHFDLIRIFDSGYTTRLEQPEIRQRIIRNLEVIRELGLIMDYNLRSLQKGASEPYISESILQMCLEMDIMVVPGDDSHGCGDIHLHMERGIRFLQEKGFNTDWPEPKIYSYTT